MLLYFGRPWIKDRYIAPDIDAVTKLLQEEKVTEIIYYLNISVYYMIYVSLIFLIQIKISILGEEYDMFLTPYKHRYTFIIYNYAPFEEYPINNPTIRSITKELLAQGSGNLVWWLVMTSR